MKVRDLWEDKRRRYFLLDTGLFIAFMIAFVAIAISL